MARTEGKTPAGRVLIADDEAAIANGLSAILSDAGYEVEVAADGQKALEALQSGQFGVVLADLKMPKMDGTQVGIELGLPLGAKHLAGDPFYILTVIPNSGSGHYTLTLDV